MIIEAQRRHNALIRRHGRRVVHDGFHHAQRIADMWRQRGERRQERDRRHAALRDQPTLKTSLALTQTIQYPEVVALTKIFIMPRWRDATSPYNLTEELVDQIRIHVIPRYNPSGASEPILSWLHYWQPHLATHGKPPAETLGC